MSASNLHSAWARLFIHALAASGVSDVVVSPGSRSTPLAMAAAAQRSLRFHSAVDERSAAFFALGQTRVTGRPTALVCTSGTAGAHYLPAILEASQSYLPLIVITADRPWELMDVAAPQTLDQLKLFGDAVRHFAELGLPDPSPLALRAVSRIAAQAVAIARGPVPGPVHVNARFRKPLEPVAMSAPESWESLVEELIHAPPTRVFTPHVEPSEEAMAEIATLVSVSARGWLVCGPTLMDPTGQLGQAVAAFAKRSGFVVLAEATSQVRFGPWTSTMPLCASFELLLRNKAFCTSHLPDVIVEIGAPPTSGAYAELLSAFPSIPRYVLARYGWNDPAGTAKGLVFGDPGQALEGIVSRLSGSIAHVDEAWSSAFVSADSEAQRLSKKLSAELPLTEGAIAATVVEVCPDRSILMIGNSMPVRDVDTWADSRRATLDVLHQRGVSGIDGLVSGAAGALVAAERPVTLLLGDISLLHDVGGLALARRANWPLVLVVVQNAGGRIFEHLPVVRSVDRSDFDKCFTMSEPLDLEHVCAAFGLRFARVTTNDELRANLNAAYVFPGATLVEAVVPPGDGALRLGRLRVELAASLERLGVRGSS